MIDFLIMLIAIFIVIGLLFLAGMRKPLFKKRCLNCGCKDKNWEVVPIGHDDFAWQHECLRRKK